MGRERGGRVRGDGGGGGGWGGSFATCLIQVIQFLDSKVGERLITTLVVGIYGTGRSIVYQERNTVKLK